MTHNFDKCELCIVHRFRDLWSHKSKMQCVPFLIRDLLKVNVIESWAVFLISSGIWQRKCEVRWLTSTTKGPPSLVTAVVNCLALWWNKHLYALSSLTAYSPAIKKFTAEKLFTENGRNCMVVPLIQLVEHSSSLLLFKIVILVLIKGNAWDLVMACVTARKDGTVSMSASGCI